MSTICELPTPLSFINGRASKAKAKEVALRHPSEPEHSKRAMAMLGSKKMACVKCWGNWIPQHYGPLSSE
jgi:hypothetical protein